MKTKILFLALLLNSFESKTQNNSSIRFDGDDDHIFIGSDTSLNITEHLTLEAWVRCEQNQSSNFPRIIDKLDDVNLKGFNFIINGGHLMMKFYTQEGFTMYIYGKKDIRDNIWHHVASIYDGKKISLYIDGKLDASKEIIVQKPFTISSSIKPLILGSEGDTLPFKGYLDEVRIWNIARDSSQIRKAKDSCLKGNEFGLVGYWPFNENKDLFTIDLSKNKNNGIIKNGAAWSNDVGFICASAQIVNLKKTPITLFPNPLTEASIIDLGNLNLPCNIKIFDMNGQLVDMYQVKNSPFIIERSNFKTGLYFANITDLINANYSINLKFMVR